MKARESKGEPTKTGKASESRESKPKNFSTSPKHSKDARQKEKTPKKHPRNPRPSKILPKLPPNPAPNFPESFRNPPQAPPKAVQNPSFGPIDFWAAYFPIFSFPREAQELPNELQIQSKIDETSSSKKHINFRYMFERIFVDVRPQNLLFFEPICDEFCQRMRKMQFNEN